MLVSRVVFSRSMHFNVFWGGFFSFEASKGIRRKPMAAWRLQEHTQADDGCQAPPPKTRFALFQAQTAAFNWRNPSGRGVWGEGSVGIGASQVPAEASF